MNLAFRPADSGYACFLGGHDLEMDAIAQLLATRPDVVVHDRRLQWGAKASVYLKEISIALTEGRRAMLIELVDDLPPDAPRSKLLWIDHHGPLAGADKPTSLEQVFSVLGFAPDLWTRELALISANDRGHIPAMLELGATRDELLDIRQRDRAAQGITHAEETAGALACQKREQHFDGRLTVVTLPHARTATVTDVLDQGLGRPGYENLLILSPASTTFFGTGRSIDALRAAHPDGWYGGSLPERGYWGCGQALKTTDLLKLLEKLL